MKTTGTDSSTHPGPFTREHIIPRELSVTEAAKALGVARATLSRLLNGRAKLSATMALRLENVFGANKQELLDMQAQFDSKSTTVPMPLQKYAPSVVSIRALDIEQWANRINARQELAALLRTLIHSTGMDLKEVDFPAYDNAERHGWDGFVEAGVATPWIPAGRSGWEFGCDKKPKPKADQAYDFRTRSVSKRDRSQLTFVFVTPRNWTGKRTWVEGKNASGEWKSVRAYDASDLEQWIEPSVTAQIWLAISLDLAVDGLRWLHQCWSDWAMVCKPPLSASLFDAAIRRHTVDLSKWFGNEPNQPLIVTADSKDEALAFLACLAEGESELSHFFRYAFVVHTPAALDKLSWATKGMLVPIVCQDEIEKQLGPFFRRFHCIIVRTSNTITIDADIGLTRLRTEDFRLALQSMGKSHHEIEQLARESAHSPTILRRRLSELPAVQSPDWAEPGIARRLIPATLVGAWDAGSIADRQIVSKIAGTDDYDAIESDVPFLSRLDDPPLWSVAQHRGVASRIDSLFAVGHFMTPGDLDALFEAAESVLSECDPALDLPEDERWAAPVYGKVRGYSEALRRGVRETLILLAVFGNQLFLARTGVNSETRAVALIRRLLSPFTFETLLSHLDDLPDYAEAAPQLFLDLIDEDLNQMEPATLELMRPVHGTFASSPLRTGLLWALELLAWRSENLPRVAPILARLSCRPIKDNWANKPEESLGTILSSRMPQTAAPVAERIRVLETLASRFPDVGWKLCMAELVQGRRITTDNRRPRWRDDANGAGTPAPKAEICQFTRKVIELVLSWHQYDLNTLSDLWNHIDDLSDQDQVVVHNLVAGWAEAADDSDKVALWRHIRSSHCFDPNDVQVTSLLQELSVRDLTAKHAWLFHNYYLHLPELDVRGLDHIEIDDQIEGIRLKALREIWDDRGNDGATALIARRDVDASLVGNILAKLVDSSTALSFARYCLGFHCGELKSRHQDCLRGLLWKADAEVANTLADEAENASEELLLLLLCMPIQNSTWRRLDSEPSEFQQEYWRNIRVLDVRTLADAETREAIDRLLEVGRAPLAFAAVQHFWDKVETSCLTRLLLELSTSESEDSSSYHFDIIGAFEELDRRTDVTREERAQLEFTYFETLEFSEHGIPNIEQLFEASPEIYAEMISLIHKRDDGLEDDVDPAVDSTRRKALTRRTYGILQRLRRIPGVDEGGAIDVQVLKKWLATTRASCTSLGRGKIGDEMIGQLLSHAPKDNNGNWPCVPVCEVLEWMASPSVGRGFIIGTLNNRGVHLRPNNGGGDPERDLALSYRSLAQGLAYDYPYVGRLLNEIADSYERYADHWDQTDEVRDRLYGS